MSSAIDQAAFHSNSAFKSSFETITEEKFFAEFGDEKGTKFIATNESASSDDNSISSIDIAECISLFAIEKVNNRIVTIIGWHVSDNTSVETLKGKDYLDGHLVGKTTSAEEKARIEQVPGTKYDLFLVGGNTKTTQGKECLLENIRRAIAEFFIEDTYTIQGEYLNLNAGTSYRFISANLQMNGTLTICRHNNRYS